MQLVRNTFQGSQESTAGKTCEESGDLWISHVPVAWNPPENPNAHFHVLPDLTHPLQNRKCLRSQGNTKMHRNTRIPRVRNPCPTTTAVTTMFEMRHTGCHVIDLC